jgi:hypothetical protein
VLDGHDVFQKYMDSLSSSMRIEDEKKRRARKIEGFDEGGVGDDCQLDGWRGG